MLTYIAYSTHSVEYNTSRKAYNSFDRVRKFPARS